METYALTVKPKLSVKQGKKWKTRKKGKKG
jgi:hypothetical protein